MANTNNGNTNQSDTPAVDPSAFYFVSDCMAKLGIQRTMLGYISDPTSQYFDPSFPPKRQLWGKRVGYYKHEVDAWIFSRPAVHGSH